MFERMVLKRVSGAVQRLENAIKTQSVIQLLKNQKIHQSKTWTHRVLFQIR
jgi:hypothetical protein